MFFFSEGGLILPQRASVIFPKNKNCKIKFKFDLDFFFSNSPTVKYIHKLSLGNSCNR